MQEVEKTESFGTRRCVKFREKIFDRHYAIAGDLAKGFLRNARPQWKNDDGNAPGNRWLITADKKLSISPRSPRSVVLDMQDCEDIANIAAAHTKRAVDAAFLRGLERAVDVAKFRLERYGIPWPVNYPIDKKTGKIKHTEKTRDQELATLARVGCPIWWRRTIKKKARRQVEGVLRESGSVVKRRAPYVSDWGLEQWINSQRSNAQLLSAMIATSEEGDEISLLECAQASISNPVNRRNELMTRIRGFEEVCDSLRLQGVLFTLTAPSKYHAYHAHSGEPVANFNGANPREVMDYLCDVWERIRAKWHREKIKTVGFRIAEPHHDGTPHFHFLLWFAPDDIDKAREIFRDYALQEDGAELGAAKHRCDAVLIDRERGSAAGYVAKYISKNIDGFGFTSSEEDDEAEIDAESGSLRARAWASIWGIRQFQQIGSISVTVYRELRRIRESMSFEPMEIQEAHAAADKGDWARFTEIMGGVFVKRCDQLLKPVYQACEKIGRYGEQVKRLTGIALRNVIKGMKADFCEKYLLKTREKLWTISVNFALIKSWQERSS